MRVDESAGARVARANRFKVLLWVALLLACCAAPSAAQVTTGNVRGVVTDPAGAVVPNARVTIANAANGNSQATQTTGEGEYQFSNLLVGTYKLTVEAANFKTLTLSDIRVELNGTTNVPAALEIGVQGETVTVSAAGTELIDTTTTNLARQFSEWQVVEHAQTSTGLGVYNLALSAPNVSSAGGVGVGDGGSVGGQRPRNNNFILDGVDNNDKSVTGPSVYVSPDTVSEFSLLANQYAAEFARSTGGQFIVATKSGTNQFHGTAYGFFRNRYLNAIDTQFKQPGSVFTRNRGEADPGKGISFMPRSDYGRFGGNVGGPLLKNRLFFFTGYERLQTGAAAGVNFEAPTANGLAGLALIPGLSVNNLNLFKQFVPVATTGSGFLTVSCAAGSAGCVGGVRRIEVGTVSLPAPNFTVNQNFILNLDYTQSAQTQHRSRYSYNRFRGIDITANLPAFFASIPFDSRIFSYSLLHSFTPRLTGETRLSYRRTNAPPSLPDVTFPLSSFDAFPNITIDELGLNIGPNPNQPSLTVQNSYQVVNNLTYLFGNHSLKFGGDFRKAISPQRFVQRERGDYIYNELDTYLRDISPEFAQRNVGGNTYYGDQRTFFAFAQDDWRYRPDLTLNLGLNYSYQEVPFGAKQQELNSIASVPGLIEFRRPRAQKRNFAPRVGLAYSPTFDKGLLRRIFGEGGTSSLRAGFSVAYDVIFDNIYILGSPPQFQQTLDVDPGQPNFLAGGGIRNIPRPTGNDPAASRSATTTFINDQQVPYSLAYTLSFQRQFLKDFSFEARYLGTRGIHLLTQNRPNRQAKVFDGPGGYLPTYLARPTQALLNSLPVTLTQIGARSNFVPAYDAAGFNQANITAYFSNGNSTYHGASLQVLRRMSNGLQGSASYTWSHLIDDTTAEVFSTVLSPRRVQDFQNLRPGRADSALDRRHRFVTSALYELPFFNRGHGTLVRALLGGFTFAGTLTFESGEKATVLSGIDANLNADNAGDRSVINPAGTHGTASRVTPLTNSAGQVVAYLANDPSAQYIQAGPGALANAGRNTLQLPGINNLDFSVFKNFRFMEDKTVQLRADLFNAFNHPQYVPGSVNGGQAVPTATSLISTLNNIAALDSGNFNRPGSVFTSNPRVIQLALRLNF